MYEPRLYRNFMGNDRFETFIVFYKETDLWVAIDKKSFLDEIKSFTFERIKYYRNLLDNFILQNKKFKDSFIPVEVNQNLPKIIKEMANVAKRSGIGPMSAVAGAFSEYIANDIKNKFNINEIIIENGGDIYLDVKEDFISSIYAGSSPLSDKVGLLIKANETPLGICTSSGTIGHSFSFGKADAVVIISKSTLLSDTYATAVCNMVKSEQDISKAIEYVSRIKEILSTVIIIKDKIAVKGIFELKILK